MKTIPYSLIQEWYEQEYSDKGPVSVYGPPQPHIQTYIEFLGQFSHIQSILDLGAGDGANAFPLAEKGYHVTAIDIAGKEAVDARAREKGLAEKIDFHLGDITKFAFEETQYDSVLCAGTFHLLSHDAIVETSQRILQAAKPHGIVYVDVVSNMRRVFQTSGEEFIFEGLANWTEQQAKDYFNKLFDEWKILEVIEFHRGADWPVKPGNYPIDPYHWSADYVCYIAQKV